MTIRCLHLHGNERLEEKTNKLFIRYMQMKDGIEPALFKGVCMDGIPTVEELSGINIFLYDVDIVEGSLVGELARRSVQKHPNTVRLLRSNSHICDVANIHALFNAFRCFPSIHAALKIWSCLFFNVFVSNVKLRATLLPEPKGKSIALVRTVFVVTAIQSLKQWDATTITVLVRRRVHL